MKELQIIRTCRRDQCVRESHLIALGRWQLFIYELGKNVNNFDGLNDYYYHLVLKTKLRYLTYVTGFALRIGVKKFSNLVPGPFEPFGIVC